MTLHKATAPTSNCFLSLQEKPLTQEPSKLTILEGGCNPEVTLHYGNQVIGRVPTSLGKGIITLGKVFAEWHPRQMSHDNQYDGKQLFSECFFSGTRQILCRVPKKPSQKITLGKIWIKNMKQMAEKIIGEGPHWASQVAAFFARYVAGGIRTREIPLTGNLLYHTAPHSHLCLYSIFFPHILY